MIGIDDMFGALTIKARPYGRIVRFAIFDEEKEELEQFECVRDNWDNLALFARRIIAADKKIKIKNGEYDDVGDC